MARQPTGNSDADRSTDVFMREVDDAVREADLQDFMQRYGWWVLGVVALGLAALAGWLFWQNHQEEQAGVRSEEYVAAIDSLKRENFEGAGNALAKLDKTGEPGYRGAAQLMQANLATQQGKSKEAIAAYQAVLSDETLPQELRDLALVRKTTVEFDTLKPQQVVDRLKGLAVEDGPWLGSAGELVALSYLEMGKNAEAGAMFALITKSKDVPQTLRSRARQMAGQLGVDTVLPEEEAGAETADKTKPAAKAEKGEAGE